MARFRLALQAIVIVACACGSAQKPYNPFKVPRESFYPALKTVALAPVRLPADAKIKESGGVFDPTTGKADEAKVKTLNAAIGRELKARFNADALLIPSIRVVNAALSHDKARWDGVSEGAGKGFWKAFVGTHSGSIRALSLVVALTDGDGQVLYTNGGGIQVLGNVTVGGGFERRPRSELFADGERNENAIHIALDPLLAGSDAM